MRVGKEVVIRKTTDWGPSEEMTKERHQQANTS